MLRKIIALITTTIILISLFLGLTQATFAQDTSYKFQRQLNKSTKFSFKNMEIDMPAGPFEGDMTIEEVDSDLTGIKTPKSFATLGKTFRFGPHGMKFKKGTGPHIRIKIENKNGKLPLWMGRVRLFYIDRDAGSLVVVPQTSIDSKKGVLQGRLDHFSDYILGVVSGWDGSNLNPFTDFINNGEEHIKIGSDSTELTNLSIVSRVASLKSRGFDINLDRMYIARRDSEEWMIPSDYYSITGVNVFDPLAISRNWVWDLPHWDGGSYSIPGYYDQYGNIGQYVVEPEKLYLPGGQVYSPKNLIGQCQINGVSSDIYDEGGMVFTMGSSGTYLSDGTRVGNGFMDRSGNGVTYSYATYKIGTYLIPYWEYTSDEMNLRYYTQDISMSRITSLQDSTGIIIYFRYNTNSPITSTDFDGIVSNMPVLTKVEMELANGSFKTLMTHSIAADGTESFTDAEGRTTSYQLSGRASTINYCNGVKSEYTKDGMYTLTHKMYKRGESTPFRTVTYPSGFNGDGVKYDDGIIKKKYYFLKHHGEPISVAYRVETYDSKTNKLLKVETTDHYLTKQYLLPEYNGDWIIDDLVARPKKVTTQIVNSNGTLGVAVSYQYEYDNWGNITKIVDPNGTETVMAYANTDSKKNISISSYDCVGTREVYDSNGNTVFQGYWKTILIADGESCYFEQVWQYDLDENGNLIPVTETYTYTYEVPTGYQNTLYSDYPVTACFDKLLTKATIVHDPIHNTDNLQQTHYKYDNKGNLLRMSEYHNGDYLHTDYTYDQYGNVLTKTDPKGNKLAFEYQATNGYNSAYLTRVYNPNLSGNQTIATFEYDLVLGRKKTATDPKGNIYRYEYDAVGRLTKEYLDNNSPTVGISRVIRYYDNDSHIELDFGGGVENRWEYGRIDYDPIVGKPKSIQRKNGNNWVTAKTIDYDSSGRLIAETDGENHTTTHAYDALNREIKTTRPDTTYTTFAWDDRKVTVTDAKGNTKTQSYNLLDRLIQVDEHPQAGVTYGTKYLYDSFYDPDKKASHLVKVTTMQTATKTADTTYTYDNLGRLLQVDYPQDGSNPMKPELYTYDQVGNLITKTVNGKTKTLAYDFYAGYRVTKVTEPDNRTVIYQYDNNDNVTDQIVSNGVNYHFDYDARNRVTNSTATIDGRNFVFGYGYDLFGRTTSITYPNRANPVTYQYDDLDRLQSIDGFVNSCSYDLDNKLTNMALANGLKNSFTYNNVDRPTNIGAANTGTLVNLNYTYDVVGNITKLNGDCYDYDGMNRLIWAGNVANQSAATSAFARGTAWAYDGAGNLTAKQTYANGQLQQSITLGYDLANRLWSAGSTTYANDEFGNRTQKVQGSDSFGYQYDGENRLSQVTKNGATILQNTYDGSGLRVKKMNNGKTTYFVYQGENPLLEYSSDDNQLTYYIYAGKKSVAEEKDGQKTFYHRDHLGSTRALTDQDGKLKGLCKYDAWGKLESTNEYDEGVVNGDMELKNILGDVQGWIPKNDQPINGDCFYNENAGINHSGALSLDNNYGGAGWSLPNLYVSPDTDYQLTGYYTQCWGGNVFAKLIYHAADGSVIAIHETGALGVSGTQWKQFTLNSHAPANAVTMEIYLTQNDPDSTILFDSIRLKVPGLQGTYDYTGKKEDDGTGLKYFGARFYDAEVGRFLTVDPKVDSFKIESPQTYNRFFYCLNNPLKFTDPDGKDIWVEGPSPGEPAGHQSVCVGNPNGDYTAYSFGMNGHGIMGEIYIDPIPGGKIEANSYLVTTKQEDRNFKQALDKMVGTEYPYTPLSTCRNFSQVIFQTIKESGIGKPGTPPQRNTSKNLSTKVPGLVSSVTSGEPDGPTSKSTQSTQKSQTESKPSSGLRNDDDDNKSG